MEKNYTKEEIQHFIEEVNNLANSKKHDALEQIKTALKHSFFVDTGDSKDQRVIKSAQDHRIDLIGHYDSKIAALQLRLKTKEAIAS